MAAVQVADPAACTELTAFRMAVESLEDGVLTLPQFARANYFRNLYPMGEFVRNQGTTRSNFTIKPSAPTDDQTLWSNASLSLGGISHPGCNPIYENIGVSFYEQTWSPKRRDFRGPIICKEHFQYQHSIDSFIDGYIAQIRNWIALTWEFALRGDTMRLGDWFVDGNKYIGPNAASTAPVAYQGLSQDNLRPGRRRPNQHWLYAERRERRVKSLTGTPARSIRSTSTWLTQATSSKPIRPCAMTRATLRWAKTAKATSPLAESPASPTDRLAISSISAPTWNRDSTSRVPATQPLPRSRTSRLSMPDQEIFTTAYKNAPYAAALIAVPTGFTVEAVRPQTAGLNFQSAEITTGTWSSSWAGTAYATRRSTIRVVRRGGILLA